MADELTSVAEVREWLTRTKGLNWIVKSSLHLRAFYWGLYFGMGLDETERAQRNSVAVRVWADTMESMPADDPFRLTELYSHMNNLRNELIRRIETDRRKATHDPNHTESDTENVPAAQATEMLFKPLLDCIQGLDEEWVRHRSLICAELERAATAPPEKVLDTLRRLDRAFRILAVGHRTAD